MDRVRLRFVMVGANAYTYLNGDRYKVTPDANNGSSDGANPCPTRQQGGGHWERAWVQDVDHDDKAMMESAAVTSYRRDGDLWGRGPFGMIHGCRHGAGAP